MLHDGDVDMLVSYLCRTCVVPVSYLCRTSLVPVHWSAWQAWLQTCVLCMVHPPPPAPVHALVHVARRVMKQSCMQDGVEVFAESVYTCR
jgi:hypothetical protein